MKGALPLLGLLLLGGGRAAAEPPPPPPVLTRAHAHNDYEHARPLLDALDRGFGSVEADVWLVDGRLRVAHTTNALPRARTLEELYLDPLRERVAAGGRVHPGGPPFQLLVDFKTEATNTYRALCALLPAYASMLTAFHPDRTDTNAVTIILSGNRPIDLLAVEAVRYAGYDGRPEELAGRVAPSLMPLVSDNWRKHFRWRGEGPLPAAERAKLRGLVAAAHAQGKTLRFWNSPDAPAGWAELWDAGVDWINTDDLDGLQNFLRHRPAPP